MPLIKSKSDKAFKKNVETEMNAGKPQKQSLAIAYSVKRRTPKANGGMIRGHQMSHAGDQMPHPMSDGGRVRSHQMASPGNQLPHPMANGGKVREHQMADAGHEPHPECMAHGGNAQYNTPHPDCMAHGGMVNRHQDDVREHQMDKGLGDRGRMDDGGQVPPPSDPITLDPDKAKKAEDGMRKAFGGTDKNVKPLAYGGDIESDDRGEGEEDESPAETIMRKRRSPVDENALESGQTPYDDLNHRAFEDGPYDADQLDDQPMDSNEHSDDIDNEGHEEDLISSVRRKLKGKR